MEVSSAKDMRNVYVLNLSHCSISCMFTRKGLCVSFKFFAWSKLGEHVLKSCVLLSYVNFKP